MPESGASGAGPRIILGIDFGKRRIGVACGDTLSRSARPLTTLTVSESGVRWNELQALLNEWRPSLVVVGLPYNVDGSESSMTVAAKAFAGELKSRFGIDVQLVDERYSSLDAQARLKSRRESGERRRRIAKEDIDAAAASVILERWLNETH